MDIIKSLQSYKDEVRELVNSQSDYHKASEMSFVIDDVDKLIKSIVEFEDEFIVKNCNCVEVGEHDCRFHGFAQMS